uniref:MADF domain-containing protein n=1 Tax=Ditylenchus dipsaci TaxID=166011 RepID=A0A915CTI7_9BILA
MTGVGSIFNMALINAYKQCHCLYDCEHPEYKVPMPTTQAWEKVAQECGASVIDCRIRWKALRDRYIKERKKNILNPLNYNRKQWPLYDEMDFLKPFVEKQRRKFPRGTPEPLTSRSNQNSSRRSKLDCSQDSMSFHEYEDKKPDVHLSTNLQVLQACEVVETPNKNAALDELLENINAAAPSSTNTAKVGNRGEKQQILNMRLESQARNDFSPQPLLSFLPRKRRFDQSRIDSADESERNLLGCLRTSVEALAKVSRHVLEENEETTFARYIAAVLSKMPVEKRNRSKLQIFTILHSIDDDEPLIHQSKNAAGKLLEKD